MQKALNNRLEDEEARVEDAPSIYSSKAVVLGLPTMNRSVHPTGLFSCFELECVSHLKQIGGKAVTDNLVRDRYVLH